MLHLGEATADGTAFGERRGRAGGALGTAIVAHALIAVALWGVARLKPDVPIASSPALASPIGRFVFTGATNGGSGRSGGGDRSPRPAARLRTPGPDAMAVPASAPTSFATPDTIAPEADPTPAMPVQPMRAGALSQLGAVDGVPGPPGGRGPGDAGVGTRPGDGGLGDRLGPGVGDGPYPIGNGVSPPQLLYRTSPQYTPEAMRAKIQGVALLSGVVAADGTLHDIRIVRSLDRTFGLDEEAIRCLRQWKFQPGTRLGRPVAVFVTFEVAFNLR